jgi:hypothetical protein
MLMPDKHIDYSESILGLGSFVLDVLNQPRTLDALWDLYLRARATQNFLGDHSFENLILALDVLFALGAIREVGETGEFQRCV